MRESNKHHSNNIIVGLIMLLSIALLYVPQATIWDEMLARLIYDYFANPAITILFSLITNYTLGSILGALAVFAFFVSKKWYQKAGFLFVTYLLLGALRLGLQIIFLRPRPYTIFFDRPYMGGIEPIGHSFPSFHAASAFFLAYIIISFLKLKPVPIMLLYVLAFFVAISRVYLGAHYPIDVLAGGFLGFAWGYISYRAIWPRFQWFTQK